MGDFNHYEILGVDTNFTRGQLKEAYHAKLFESHPDKNAGRFSSATSDRGKLEEKRRAEIIASVEELKNAYTVLSDPVKREAYDLELAEKSQRSGFNVTGSGLDEYTLEEFDYIEENGEPTWTRDCPRCTSSEAIVLRENDLEEGTSDGTGGYRIAVSCLICSLWISVSYEEEQE